VDKDVLKLRKNLDQVSTQVLLASSKINHTSGDVKLNKEQEESMEHGETELLALREQLQAERGGLKEQEEEVIRDKHVFKSILANLQKDIYIYKDRIKRQQEHNTRLKLKYD
jgi:hypothetical protein